MIIRNETPHTAPMDPRVRGNDVDDPSAFAPPLGSCPRIGVRGRLRGNDFGAAKNPVTR